MPDRPPVRSHSTVSAYIFERPMTQQAVADRLRGGDHHHTVARLSPGSSCAQLTGHRLPQASISAMERGFDGERRRRFDAHELYLLSVVFDVPIAYFFIPPPGPASAELADTRRPVSGLWRSLLGTEDQLDAVDARLAEIKIEDPEATDEVLAAIFGPEGAAGNWHEHFRTWRKRRLREIEVEYGDRLDEVAEFLAEFATKVKALGPAGYLRSTSHRAGEPVNVDEED